jgi:hypothetical protein
LWEFDLIGLKKTTFQRKPSGNKPGVIKASKGKTLELVETPEWLS